ncbi:MAG: hypothetical protein HQM14_07490 [SAR324 cluster bacterium]|nr:hypothetical protein [SAR324 cluster bacterium]
MAKYPNNPWGESDNQKAKEPNVNKTVLTEVSTRVLVGLLANKSIDLYNTENGSFACRWEKSDLAEEAVEFAKALLEAVEKA